MNIITKISCTGILFNIFTSAYSSDFDNWKLVDWRSFNIRNTFLGCVTPGFGYCSDEKIRSSYETYKNVRKSLIKDIEELYNSGYKPAGYILADILLESKHTSKYDLNRAVDILNNSSSNNGLSSSLLGDLFISGRLGEIEIDNAIEHYTNAYKFGLTYAAMQLVRIEMSGIDIPSFEPYEVIRALYDKSPTSSLYFTDTGSYNMFEGIDFLKRSGRGYELYLQWATRWLWEGTIGPISFYEAYSLSKGEDADNNIEEIVDLLEKSSNARVQHAQVMLAIMYESGVGIEKSDNLALKYWDDASFRCSSPQADFGILACNSALKAASHLRYQAIKGRNRKGTSIPQLGWHFPPELSVEEQLALAFSGQIPDEKLGRLLEQTYSFMEDGYQFPPPRPILALPWDERGAYR